jgi:hypothetical protein
MTWIICADNTTNLVLAQILRKGDDFSNNPLLLRLCTKRDSCYGMRDCYRWNEVRATIIEGGLAMPLRDHFHAPLAKQRSWEELHGQWPAMMVVALARKLPSGYVAGPRVHLGPYFEIDVASFESDELAGIDSASGEEGGVATAVWAPPRPTLEVTTDLPDQDEYEVRVYDTERERRLVAAVEIVSPGNIDRPESRRAFVAKCAALLRQDVSVAIVDVVTIRPFNLYTELLAFIGQTDPAVLPEPPALYAAAFRWTSATDAPRPRPRPRLQTWAYPLAVGRPLPTLPLWLANNLAVPLELEASYEETCQILRIR